MTSQMVPSTRRNLRRASGCGIVGLLIHRLSSRPAVAQPYHRQWRLAQAILQVTCVLLGSEAPDLFIRQVTARPRYTGSTPADLLLSPSVDTPCPGYTALLYSQDAAVWPFYTH